MMNQVNNITVVFGVIVSLGGILLYMYGYVQKLTYGIPTSQSPHGVIKPVRVRREITNFYELCLIEKC